MKDCSGRPGFYFEPLPQRDRERYFAWGPVGDKGHTYRRWYVEIIDPRFGVPTVRGLVQAYNEAEAELKFDPEKIKGKVVRLEPAPYAKCYLTDPEKFDEFMRKEVKELLPLDTTSAFNELQRIALDTYEYGEFAHLADDYLGTGMKRLDRCGDGLITWIVKELEDVETVGEGTRRMLVAIRQITQVIEGLRKSEEIGS